MTILVTAVVSAVVSALVAFLYERLTAERRLGEVLAKQEITHDREMMLEMTRSLMAAKETFPGYTATEADREAYADELAHAWGPLLNELSNRGIRKMMENDVWSTANMVAWDWRRVGPGRQMRDRDNWWAEFDNDVELARDGIEAIIGGEADFLPKGWKP